jgi:hypothetical protein
VKLLSAIYLSEIRAGRPQEENVSIVEFTQISADDSDDELPASQ